MGGDAESHGHLAVPCPVPSGARRDNTDLAGPLGAARHAALSLHETRGLARGRDWSLLTLPMIIFYYYHYARGRVAAQSKWATTEARKRKRSEEEE